MDSLGKDKKELNYTEKELVQVLLKQLNDPREEFNIFALRELKHYHSAEIVEKLASIIKKDSTDSKKLEAIRSLKARKPNYYVKDLVIDQLKSPSEEVRSEAADFLREYGEIIEKDVYSFLDTEIPRYSKEKAIWLLGQIGDKNALKFLEGYNLKNKQKLEEPIKDSIASIKNRNVLLLLDDLKKKEE